MFSSEGVNLNFIFRRPKPKLVPMNHSSKSVRWYTKALMKPGVFNSKHRYVWQNNRFEFLLLASSALKGLTLNKFTERQSVAKCLWWQLNTDILYIPEGMPLIQPIIIDSNGTELEDKQKQILEGRGECWFSSHTSDSWRCCVVKLMSNNKAGQWSVMFWTWVSATFKDYGTHLILLYNWN